MEGCASHKFSFLEETAMDNVKSAVEPNESANSTLSVSDFCARYQLGDEEEQRLRKLFGDYASRHELIINVQRKPNFR
jgi:hypothetical protein